MTTNFIELFEKFWGVIVALAGGAAGFLQWNQSRKSSTDLLYSQLEELKIQVIAQVSRDISKATEISQKQRIINEFKLHCPGCYSELLEKFKDTEYETFL